MPTTNQVSDEVLAAAPPYIVVGEAWDDPEWRAAAAKPSAERTEHEKYLFMGGPRPNPWGFSVFQGMLPDGREAYFPSRAAYDAFVGGQARQNAEPTLAALARGLSAQGKVAQHNAQVAANPTPHPTVDEIPLGPDTPLPGA